MELRKHVGTKPLIISGAGVILLNGTGKMLLQRRTDNGCWGIPGGAMELEESFEETARREVLEETGLRVGKLDLFYLSSGQHTYYEYPNGDQVYLACAIFTSREFDGEINMDESETLGLQWFHPNDLPSNLNPNDVRPIHELAQKLQNPSSQHTREEMHR